VRRRHVTAAFAVAVAWLVGAAPAQASGRSCKEESESAAVGYAKCRRFGGWDSGSAFRPGPEFTLGMNLHQLDLSGRPLSICGPGDKCQRVAYGTVKETSWSDLHATVKTGFVRITLFSLYAFHFGLHAEAGGGGGPSQVRAPGATGGATSVTYGSFGVFTGARTSLGRFVLGGDLLFGASEVQADTSWLKIRGVGMARSDLQSDTRVALQADVSLVYYVHPGIGLGLRAGAEMLHASEDFFGGAVLRFSFEPYEGTRTF
jgi:hypothetical protein